MNFRRAAAGDVYLILELMEKASPPGFQQPHFDVRVLRASLESESIHWILGSTNAGAVAALCLDLDPGQKICKLTQILIDPAAPARTAVLRGCLRATIAYLPETGLPFDLVYVTTQTVSLDDHRITAEEGFTVLGIFPNVTGWDATMMNGIAAFYYPGVLERKRDPSFRLHPTILPFFELTRKKLDLPELLAADPVVAEYPEAEALPPLEMIRAQKFVLSRFNKLRQRQAQLNNFYPFRLPNCLLTDPDQRIEIFLHLKEDIGFAAVIGETLEGPVDPVRLYLLLLRHLRQAGVSYVEAINDASDTHGISCILEAGFVPCAYVPAFKETGRIRRDYVVFGKSFESLSTSGRKVSGAYEDFYREYARVEKGARVPEAPTA